MIFSKDSNRLISYAFYDRDGIVDSYVLYMLERLQPFCKRLILVSNGDLSADSKASLDDLNIEYIERPNKGLDISGHRELMNRIGWDELSRYDEFIMTNDTLMGPIKPLENLFDTMNACDVDFWGLSAHSAGEDGVPYDNKYGFLSEHIQSYFIAIRKTLLQSNDFHDYWETMPEICSYKDAVTYHETIFTKHFSDLGYKWKTFIPLDALDDYSFYPMLFCPKKLITEFDCPFFKKRSFFNDYFVSIHTCYANQTAELYDFLRYETDYDVNMIWDNILRVDCMSDIQNNLNLSRVLPSDFSKSLPKGKSIALHIDIRNSECANYCYEQALSMPNSSDVYLSCTQECRKSVETIFKNGPWKNLEFLEANSNPYDWYIPSELLEVFNNYDYVCTLHDIEEMEYPEHISMIGEAHTKRCFSNLIGSKHIVSNIVNEFEANPRLGILASPLPYINNYYQCLGNEWGGDYNYVREFSWRMGLTSPIKSDKAPALASSCCFWFRPKALSQLFKYISTREYSQFGADCDFKHAAEKIVPLVAQDAGYYTANVLSDKNADSEVQNLRYIVQTLNQQISKEYEIESFYSLLLLMRTPYPKYFLKKKVHDAIGEDNWVKLREMYHKHGGKFWLG